MYQNVKLLSVWKEVPDLGVDIFDQHQPKEFRLVLESLGSGLEESREAQLRMVLKTKTPSMIPEIYRFSGLGCKVLLTFGGCGKRRIGSLASKGIIEI